MLDDLIRLALADAALVFGSFTLLWAIGLAMRDSSLVDIWFAPCIARRGGARSVSSPHGAEPRRVLIAVLAVIWATRLGGYLLWRNWGREDARYARFRKHVEDQGKSFRLVQPDADQPVPGRDGLHRSRADHRGAGRADARGAGPARLARRARWC